MKKTVLGVILLGLITFGGVLPTSAKDVSTTNGSTDVTFEGLDVDHGGLVLNEVADIAFTKTTTGNSNYVIDGAGNKGIKVTDLRGGDEGWTVTAKANELTAQKNSTTYTLPVSAVEVTIADVTETRGCTSANIYSAANKICSGTKDSNGTWVSAAPTAQIFVNQAGVKALTYTGTIEYTLSDAL